MKKTIKIACLFAFSLLMACGGNAEKTNEESNTENLEESKTDLDLSGLEAHDLSAYDIPASVYLPTDQGSPELRATEWGSVEIQMGEKFGLEIVPFGLSVQEKKEELDADLMYTIDYLDLDENSFSYKKSIADSDVAPEFHFFMTHEIDGELYEIKSLAAMSLKEHQMKKAFNSAKSFQKN